MHILTPYGIVVADTPLSPPHDLFRSDCPRVVSDAEGGHVRPHGEGQVGRWDQRRFLIDKSGRTTNSNRDQTLERWPTARSRANGLNFAALGPARVDRGRKGRNTRSARYLSVRAAQRKKLSAHGRSSTCCVV
jgi:hypothetical protein